MTHREAVEEALAAAAGALSVADRPVIELARALADQMDAAGPNGPGTRLAGTYLTALRTLRAVTGSGGTRKTSGSLAKLRSLPSVKGEPA